MKKKVRIRLIMTIRRRKKESRYCRRRKNGLGRNIRREQKI